MHRATTIDWLLLAVLLASGLLSAGSAWSAGRWQSHADIRAAAEAAVRQALADPAEVTADRPDPRLRLADCSAPLEARVPATGVRSARLTVEVRCPGEQPWRLFLPVRISVSRDYVVTTRALARDAILAPGDVRLAKADAGVAPAGVLRDPARAVGQRLRRPMEEGQAVTTALLAAPTLVRRGQQVTVQALAGGIQVQMAGVARGDGALGDIIEVENGSSGRVVQAVVRSAKSVEVLLR